MSRIGKNPITIPSGVSVSISGTEVAVKGAKGELSMSFTDNISIKEEDGAVVIKPKDGSKFARQMWGTAAAQIKKMILGVSEGVTKTLQISGVGYRAQAKGPKSLTLALGFSHDVEYEAPEGVTFETPDQTTIKISGSNAQKVGQVAAEIRGFRPPEPYKGKGVKYADEVILRKEGKKK
ncbi:MAG: 50S ribosomal protein L6 [Alphaproteobacteria bacterium]